MDARPTHPVLLLASCVREKRDGTLTIKTNKVVRQFRFKNGDLVSFFTNTKAELAATLLHKKNLLSKEAYEKHLTELPTLKTDPWDHFLFLGTFAKETLPALRTENLRIVMANLGIAAGVEHSFQTQTFPTSEVLLSGPSFVLLACAELSAETILAIQPAFGEDTAGILLPKAFEKEIPPLPITPEERGLITVLQHNKTVKEVFSASFLGRERILKLLLAYWMLEWTIVKGTSEKIFDDLLSSLTPEQLRVRQECMAFVADISVKSYYDWLSVARYALPQEIQQSAMKIMEHSHSPATEKVFLPAEKSQLKQILQHAEMVLGILLHPAKRAQYDAFLSSGKSGSFVEKNRGLQALDTIAHAQRLEKDGKKEAVVQVFEEATNDSDASPEVLYAFVLALLRMFGPADTAYRDKALGLMKRLLDKHPQHMQVLLCASEWLKATNQTAKAYEFLKKGFALYPHQPYFRAQLLCMHESVPEAPAVVIEHLYSARERLNLYQWLNISPQATLSDIRNAYRECSKTLHPDRFFQTDSVDLKDKAKHVYKRIVEAYSTLKDHNKKRSYDEAAFAGTPKNLQA